MLSGPLLEMRELVMFRRFITDEEFLQVIPNGKVVTDVEGDFMLKVAVSVLTTMVVLIVALMPVHAQLSAAAEWAAKVQNQYEVIPNVTYMTASGYDSKLDVNKRRDIPTAPTLVYYHGGGWVGGVKETASLSLLSWLEMGWNVINVEYRLAKVAPAPAAVEDAMCALRFIVEKAKEYAVDTNRIVVSGDSAGGHLALAVGMIPESAGFTRACASRSPVPEAIAVPKVAAIINFYGITDVVELLGGPNARWYALRWFGAIPNREEIARSVSPLTYVRPNLPPTLTIQGDADPIVPYSQNLRLRDALTKAGVPNELMTIPGGGHGNFKPEERVKISLKIRDFLAKNGVMSPGTISQ